MADAANSTPRSTPFCRTASQRMAVLIDDLLKKSFRVGVPNLHLVHCVIETCLLNVSFMQCLQSQLTEPVLDVNKSLV